MRLALSLFSIIAVSLLSPSAFAEPAISFDKSSYVYGDTINVAGKVQYEDGMVVIIQLRSPSDIVAIAQFMPHPEGSFSTSFEANGPKWQESGTYKVIVSYSGQKTETTFQFSNPQPTTETETTQPTQETKQEPTQKPIQEQQTLPQKPKVTIKGFPDITMPPKYYYDRYDDEPEFKSWFDSTFPGYTIQDIVGYKPTHVPGFPDPQYSPQYYIDRYNYEPLFKDWFDTYFPETTIYDLVGVPEEVRSLIPGWIKQYAKLWSTGDIDDDQFIRGITDLIDQNIISVDDDIIKTENGDASIPDWFKIVAGWYSQGLIPEKDFLSGIQYLIEKEIIVV